MPLMKSVLLLITLSQCGCIGFSVVYPTTLRKEYEDHSSSRFEPNSSRQSRSNRSIQESMEDYYYLRGQPEIEHLEDGSITYTYSLKYTWLGGFVACILPVPLLIPIGRDYFKFTVKDGYLLSKEYRYTKDIFLGIRPQFGIHGVGWVLGVSSNFRRKYKFDGQYH